MAMSKQSKFKKFVDAVTGVNCDCVDDFIDCDDSVAVDEKTTLHSRRDSKQPVTAGATYNIYNDYSGATFTFNIERVDNFNTSDVTRLRGGMNSAPQLSGATGGALGAPQPSLSPSQPDESRPSNEEKYGVICDGAFLTAKQIAPTATHTTGSQDVILMPAERVPSTGRIVFLAVQEIRDGKAWHRPISELEIPLAQLEEIKKACAKYKLRLVAQ